MAVKTKVCPKCGFRKGMDFFGYDRSAKDGRQKICSQCSRDYRNKFKNRLRGNKALDDV